MYAEATFDMRFSVRFAPLMLVLWLAVACGTPPTPPPDPLTLLDSATQIIHEVDTFQMEVNRTGAAYFIPTILGDVSFERATMQYRAPESLQGIVRAKLRGVVLEFGVLAIGDQQWVRLPGIAWDDSLAFAPGFNPQDMIATDSGFEAALKALLDIEMQGIERLEDGTAVYHLSGHADGQQVMDILAGLIYAEGQVLVDVYIDTQTNQPLRLIITQPETQTETEPEPTRWNVDLFDFNQPVTIDDPFATPAE